MEQPQTAKTLSDVVQSQRDEKKSHRHHHRKSRRKSGSRNSSKSRGSSKGSGSEHSSSSSRRYTPNGKPQTSAAAAEFYQNNKPFPVPSEALTRKKIIVAARTRPIFEDELSSRCTKVVTADGSMVVLTEALQNLNLTKEREKRAEKSTKLGLDYHPDLEYLGIQQIPFALDYTQCDSTGDPSEQSIFVDELGGVILNTVWAGSDIGVVCFGPSATGKSYTLFGPGSLSQNNTTTTTTDNHQNNNNNHNNNINSGLISRVAEQLFLKCTRSQGTVGTPAHSVTQTYETAVGVLEVHLGNVRDLLKPLGSDLLKVEVNADDAVVLTPAQSMVAVDSGAALRTQLACAELMLEHKPANWQLRSRGHLVYTLSFKQTTTEVTRKDNEPEHTERHERTSKLIFVNLTEFEHSLDNTLPSYFLVENVAANPSLLSLSDAVALLQSRTDIQHVSPKSMKSPIAMLLHNAIFSYFGKMIFIAHVSPVDIHFNETFGTLRFAQRLFTEQLASAQRHSGNNKELKTMLEALEAERAVLQKRLYELHEEKTGLALKHNQQLVSLNEDLRNEKERSLKFNPLTSSISKLETVDIPETQQLLDQTRQNIVQASSGTMNLGAEIATLTERRNRLAAELKQLESGSSLSAPGGSQQNSPSRRGSKPAVPSKPKQQPAAAARRPASSGPVAAKKK
eukprot:gnl/Spiro4/8226_TR4348_c0_g1_i1.p1 gnl/Spiro4/8226_TR4348_c0_g1~~gnl/Spiro4/8226_TR4348_c0_g1_i1.p1  ORF type:complete len:680 (+),score=194.55 gnl/Spiro4/8226_TR4348_c0_g1_i1:110-2149(+)